MARQSAEYREKLNRLIQDLDPHELAKDVDVQALGILLSSIEKSVLKRIHENILPGRDLSYLSREADVPWAYLWRWVHGQSKISPERLFQIYQVLERMK